MSKEGGWKGTGVCQANRGLEFLVVQWEMGTAIKGLESWAH